MFDECNRRTTVLFMHERCLFGHQSEKKNGVGMALDMATLP